MLPTRYLQLIILVFWCLRLDNWCVVIDVVNHNILDPTIKCFMLDYKYTDPLLKVQASDQRVQKNNFPGMYSGVSQESFSCKLIDLPSDVPLVWKINQGYMVTDSFDLGCENVTCAHVLYLLMYFNIYVPARVCLTILPLWCWPKPFSRF